MNNKCIRKFDNQGRITIPKVLCDIAQLSGKQQLLLIKESDDVISFEQFCNIDSVTNPIIGTITLDEKRRCYIPNEFMVNDSVELFCQGRHIYMK